jgi:hypothetical protein
VSEDHLRQSDRWTRYSDSGTRYSDSRNRYSDSRNSYSDVQLLEVSEGHLRQSNSRNKQLIRPRPTVRGVGRLSPTVRTATPTVGGVGVVRAVPPHCRRNSSHSRKCRGTKSSSRRCQRNNQYCQEGNSQLVYSIYRVITTVPY